MGADNKFFTVIIVGERGSGKTRLMKWIEREHPDVVAVIPKKALRETEIHEIVMRRSEGE